MLIAIRRSSSEGHIAGGQDPSALGLIPKGHQKIFISSYSGQASAGPAQEVSSRALPQVKTLRWSYDLNLSMAEVPLVPRNVYGGESPWHSQRLLMAHSKQGGTWGRGKEWDVQSQFCLLGPWTLSPSPQELAALASAWLAEGGSEPG